MTKINWTTKYINDHLGDNNIKVCKWLTHYIHTSYRYVKKNPDGSYLNIQPGWPDETVVGYTTYYEPTETKKHGNRMILLFETGSTIEVSLYKFKKFVRSFRNNI